MAPSGSFFVRRLVVRLSLIVCSVVVWCGSGRCLAAALGIFAWSRQNSAGVGEALLGGRAQFTSEEHGHRGMESRSFEPLPERAERESVEREGSRSLSDSHHRRPPSVPVAASTTAPRMRGGKITDNPVAFIKLKDKMRSVWESVKSGATKMKEGFNGGQLLAVMSSPALAGTGSPLAMPPVVQPQMDINEATSMHGAFIVLMCVAMVTILLAIVLVCFCVSRQRKHDKIMRMKPKDVAA